MNSENRFHIRLIQVTLIVCISFFVLTALAMVLYPGGMIGNPYTKGYSFWLNFFSDLGRSKTFLLEPKPASLFLFSFSLIFTGLAVVAFFSFFPRLFHQDTRRIAWVGCLFGTIAGYCYIVIALTPWDLFLGIHLTAVRVGFLSFFIMCICIGISIWRTPQYPRIYLLFLCVFSLILMCFLMILFFGPKPLTLVGVRIQATAQKIVVYSEMVCMVAQAHGALRILRAR